MKNIFVVFSAMIVACGFAANTWYVDDDNYQKKDENGNLVELTGKTQELAFGTIQDAIDAKTTMTGDTILVLPGTYDKGGAVNGTAPEIHTNRVVLTKKVYIQSTGGASVTHIVGAPDPDTGGVGPAAIRCVVSPDSNSTNARLIGFTLRDGYGDDGSSGHNHRSGGFLQYNGNKWIFLTDCVISNCVAYSHGGVRGGTCVRCLFVNNRVTKDHGSGTAVGESNLLNCLMTRNGDADSDYTVYGGTMVNCTVVANRGYGVSKDAAVKNSIICQCCSGTYMGTPSASVIGGEPLVSPFSEDYRVAKGDAAETAGLAANLSSLPFNISGTTANIDLTGKEFDITGTTVMAGAIQSAAEVKTGAVVIYGAASYRGVKNDKNTYTYLRGTTSTNSWAVTFYPAKFNDGEAFNNNLKYPLCLGRQGAVTTTGYFDRENRILLFPAPDVEDVYTNVLQYGKGRWVDPDSAHDASDDYEGSEAKPYRTLQGAVDNAGANTVIFLKKGVYDQNGKGDATGAATLYGSNRVCVAVNSVRITSVEGPEKTIIVGASDPDTKGLGPCAMRCFRGAGSCNVLQGVTLSNGWTTAETEGQRRYGAAQYGGVLCDCRVTCCEGKGSVFFGAYGYRNRVYGNTCETGSLFDGNAGRTAFSWIGPNTSKSSSYYGYFGSGTIAYFTTMIITNGQSAFSQNAAIYNCVAVEGEYLRAAMSSKGNLFWKFSNVESASKAFTDADPYLSIDNLHPVSSVSSVFTASTLPTVAEWEAAQGSSRFLVNYASFDIDGNELCITGDKICAGAAHTIAAGANVYVADEITALSLSTGSRGAQQLAEDDSLTIGFSDQTATRPITGFYVNDVFYAYPAGSATISYAAALANPVVVKLAESTDWYVDAVNGDNAKSGFTADTAKKTLAAAMSDTRVAAGDTIHAAAGTYSEGEMKGTTYEHAARVIVKSGVTLKADKGAAQTTILGASATGENDLWQGCGTGAVRCVELQYSSTTPTRLVGFTLRGGRARYYNGVGVISHSYDCHYHPDNTGAGVLGQINYGETSMLNERVEDCILTDCKAYRGAAARYVTLVRCRIYGNTARNSAAAAGDCIMMGSLTYGNEDLAAGYTDSRLNVVSQMYNVYDSTIADGIGNPRVGGKVYNSLLLGVVAATNFVYYRCAINAESGIGDTPVYDGTCVVALSQLAVDTDYRPIVGGNVAIDLANDTYVNDIWDGTDLTDLSGAQRVMNGTRDIGALEADWRARYKQDLSAEGLIIDAVSPTIVENVTADETVVRENDGATWTAHWQNPTGRKWGYELVFRVVGSGSLTLDLNGVKTTYAPSANDYTVSFSNALARNAFTATYDAAGGEGYVEWIRAGRRVGFTLFVR